MTGSASRDMRGSVRYDVNTWSRQRHQCTAAGIKADNKGKRLLPAILSRQRVGAAFQCIWQSYFLARHSQLFLVNFPIVWLAASCGHLPLSGNQLSARGLRTEREGTKFDSPCNFGSLAQETVETVYKLDSWNRVGGGDWGRIGSRAGLSRKLRCGYLGGKDCWGLAVAGWKVRSKEISC